MRNISFHNRKKLDELVVQLEHDLLDLKQKFNDYFDKDLLGFINWNMEDMIQIKCTIDALKLLQLRLDVPKSEVNTTLQDFCVWHLTAVNYKDINSIGKYTATAWKEILDEIRFFEDGE